MGSDEREIRELIERWHERTAAGDLEAILELMADDVVFLRAGQPPMDKKEFAAGFRAWASKASIRSRWELKDVHASGDIAYAWSEISLVMTSKDGGKQERSGPALSVFRKSRGGRWLLARDANLVA